MDRRNPGLRKRLGLALFSHLYAADVAAHRLQTLFGECMLRCNLSCRHCGGDCRADATQPDMPLADFLRVLDEEVTPHTDSRDMLVVFSGGEALLRADRERDGSEVTHRGYARGMVTSGMAFDAARLRSLRDAGLRSISISFDGFPEQHIFIRCHAASWLRALDAIWSVVRAEGLACDGVTCVTPSLVPRLEAFRDLLEAEGVRHWRLFPVFPAGRARDDAALCLTGAGFRALLEFIRHSRKRGVIDLSYTCEEFLGGYETEVRDPFYQCGAGVSVASVRADGAIAGCTSVRADLRQGNIYTDRFWDVWERRFEKFRDRAWTRTGACAACGMFRYRLGGGMHLREADGTMLDCSYRRLQLK